MPPFLDVAMVAVNSITHVAERDEWHHVALK